MERHTRGGWSGLIVGGPLLLLGLADCDHGARRPTRPAESPARQTAHVGFPPAEVRTPPVVVSEVVFRGTCDASGAVPLSSNRFVVADDEDNILRVYDADAGGIPLMQTDVSFALGLPLKGKKNPRPPELDLEAGTRVGNRAYWLTSHGRKKSGKLDPARLLLFATSMLDDGDQIELVGHPYERLVDDLVAAPHLASFGLEQAAQKSPKSEGGLNIEGLAAGQDGQILVAFRNPVPAGRALLVPLLNLEELVASANGGPARFGDPVLLDLGGRGVRSLSWWRGRYLLIGGSPSYTTVSKLYVWDGKGQAHEVRAADFRAHNPEGFFTPEERDVVLILSDDGERPIDGIACKRLKDAERKQFRGLWVDLRQSPAAPR
jgi:hypothetical protein